jgi:hypothetical protein
MDETTSQEEDEVCFIQKWKFMTASRAATAVALSSTMIQVQAVGFF